MKKREHDDTWEMVEQGCKEIQDTTTTTTKKGTMTLQLQGGINAFAAVGNRQR